VKSVGLYILPVGLKIFNLWVFKIISLGEKQRLNPELTGIEPSSFLSLNCLEISEVFLLSARERVLQGIEFNKTFELSFHFFGKEY
jgi:hypothetical protein